MEHDPRHDEPTATPSENPDPSEHSARPSEKAEGVSRRSLLQWGAAAGASASLIGLSRSARAEDGEEIELSEVERKLEEATIADLQAQMAAGSLTALQLVNRYLGRIGAIDRRGPRVNSLLEVNPDARAIAQALDDERRTSGPRGPLHGIPVVLKDNIDTGDEMMTTAGSLALVGAPALQDATVTERLRAAGAIILGKANLSEWANFRGFSSSSGWSGRGGQSRNPYILDRNPCGSSAGSAAAVSANLCAVSLGTETDGSIVCPASINGVVGIKPTVGLTSRAGVIPISSTQDTVGPYGRTVADAAAVLGALTGVDPRDPATSGSAGNFFTDYTQFLDANGLDGARIGALGSPFAGFSPDADAVYADALAAMQAAGATVVDAFIPTTDQLLNDPAELIVLIWEFKRDLNAYLATRTGVPVADMADVIEFNLANFEDELLYFGQEWFELSQAEIFTEEDYLAAVERGPRLAGPEGIDAVMDDLNLDALVAPTASPSWSTDLVNGDLFLGASSTPAAMAGYPSICVPAGAAFGLPIGISIFGRAYSESTLIRVASGFEAVTRARQAPTYRQSLETPVARRPGSLRLKGRSERSMRARLGGLVAGRRQVPFL